VAAQRPVPDPAGQAAPGRGHQSLATDSDLPGYLSYAAPHALR